jgi:Lhr-like helicase
VGGSDVSASQIAFQESLQMDVFDLDQKLVADYEQFARSFTQIRAEDIRKQIDDIYASRRFWPEPLISINPHFERGASVEELVANGSISPETGQVFRVDGRDLVLHRHQQQALAKASAGTSFVVTTGTGSGKSLCFFVPIIERVIQARRAGEAPRTKAIIIYPMNALANSQMKELEKFLEQSGLPPSLLPTFARYTGQETAAERDLIREAKPDILLTNFMMLELLMTRQNARDRAVIASAEGLDFLVLDELHTYRGRQGADVAMLVRRVRDRLCREKAPICIGTSATMSSEAGDERRAVAVAAVATRLFGVPIGPDAVIDESLQRATDAALRIENLGARLRAAVDEEMPAFLTDEQLKTHPLAVWVELRMGLKDGRRLERHPPVTIADAAKRLSDEAGRPEARCREQLQKLLTLMSLPASARGGVGERAFLAFKLHRFISGAGFAYATLRKPGQRRVTLDGQRFDPEDPEARLYGTFFCRSCGQEYHPVTLVDEGGVSGFIQRSMDDTPTDDPDEADQSGYLMPEPLDDPDFDFTGDASSYPEEWVESGPSGLRLKSDKRKFAPVPVFVEADGAVGASGRRFWFTKGKFRFCLACRHTPPGQARELTKLASLSAEGRSSATTLLASSVLRWMNNHASSVPDDKRKLLCFTDNRQDAALQAGHFNDFLFVSLLRAATLAALRKAGAQGLGDDEIGNRTQEILGFVPENRGRRAEWMLDAEAKGVALLDAATTISRVLSHRIWADQRQGWRYTNPNLEQLGLLRVSYLSLRELAEDQEAFNNAPAELRLALPETRLNALTILLDAMRKGLAVTTEWLSRTTVDEIGAASRQRLRDPWTLGQQERLRQASALMINPPNREEAGVRGENLIIRAGSRSALAKRLNRAELWGRRLPAKDYEELLESLLRAAETYGLIRSVPTVFDVDGWRLAANAVRFVAGHGAPDQGQSNRFFVSLYETLADSLLHGGNDLFGLEGREHTAQVDQQRREWREWRFRWGKEDRELLASDKEAMRLAGEPDDFLPVLFCSPTMELGVDISALNAVYLRNVPPTPANYAQRSGRAGRSGQAAMIITYCSAQGPHDQYYFNRPEAMVSGVVKPPALELANRDLIEAHLHAVWLAESGVALAPDIPHLLDLSNDGLPLTTDIAAPLGDPALQSRAAVTMKRILDNIKNELAPEKAPWAKDRWELAENVAAEAHSRFSAAFDRWRQLYSGARAQLQDANRRTEMHGLSAVERKEAKAQQAQANEQILLLERGTASGGSDFYSYRYLATEGFLPGYNFPRLPLYAFVPTGGHKDAKAAYLQRARFLAISEFGPRSLIYHEGRAYRVHKARLPAGLRLPDGRLATERLFICDDCGAAHKEEPELCHACDASMAGVHPIREILRIDNVETTPAERITANDEERQRQGFEIQTVFSWPSRDDRCDVQTAVASDADGWILRVDYAPGALVSRVNKGLRRRKEKTILGFGIDPASGRWTKGLDEDSDGGDENTTAIQRVVPIVQDNKNAALIRLIHPSHDEEVMTTIQHAMARGLDLVFQLEEGETLSEPTPSRDRRRAILAFEATEGGAGVLGRLISEPDSLARVARAALELMHLDNIDAAIAAGDPALLEDVEGAECVKGCYRCLLSYYNQPDHELIDRTNIEARRVLLRLARSRVAPQRATAEGDSLWAGALMRWGLPAPDSASLTLDGVSVPLVWRSYLAAAATAPLPQEAMTAASAMGLVVVNIPDMPGDSPPAELVALLKGQA